MNTQLKNKLKVKTLIFLYLHIYILGVLVAPERLIAELEIIFLNTFQTVFHFYMFSC